MMMSWWKRNGFVSAMALVLTLALISVAGVDGYVQGAERPGQGKTLVLGYGMWTADNSTIYVSKVLLEDYLGYKVDVAELTIPAIWAAMADGQVHAFTNAWFPNSMEFLTAYGDKVEVIATHYDDATMALVVPTWVAEQYDVYTWEDLFRPEVVRLFDTDRDGKGDILGCDIAWTCWQYLDDKLEEYGLDAHYVQQSVSEQMQNFEVVRAMRTRDPLLWLGWTPDWVFSVYRIGKDVTLLRDPWGYHPEPEGAEIDEYGWTPSTATTVVHKSLREEHPEAYRLLSQISIPLHHQNDWIYAESQEGVDTPRKLEQYARRWIEENREIVDGWLEASGLR